MLILTLTLHLHHILYYTIIHCIQVKSIYEVLVSSSGSGGGSSDSSSGSGGSGSVGILVQCDGEHNTRRGIEARNSLKTFIVQCSFSGSGDGISNEV